MLRVCVVGEGMVEFSGRNTAPRIGYGGDAINVAVHLARLGFDIRLVSALGDDPYSAELRAAWEADGIDTGLVSTVSGRLPGLYGIRVDDSGERTFHYWRGESAARAMFDVAGADAVLSAAAETELLYFSLISLAILPEPARRRLLALAREVRRRGGRVAFDGNFRAKLWPTLADAIANRDEAAAVADFGLPTLVDEIEMGEVNDAAAAAARWRGLGCGEVVIKLGRAGCLVGDHIVAPSRECRVVDTSGAGDAFNAGYLHARLLGHEPEQAALAGHRLSGWCVERFGAVPAIDTAAPYDLPSLP